MKNIHFIGLSQIVYSLKAQNPPGDSMEFYCFGLAIELLRIYLGNEWANRVIFPYEEPSTKSESKAKEFLKTNNTLLQNRYRNQDRIIRFAELLYNLQDVLGIDNVISKIKSQGLESYLSELECASFFKRRNIGIEFVVESGEIGKDYDLEIKISDSIYIPCEIETKIESTHLSKKSIWNTLDKGRKQLPRDCPGIIFLKIPEAWIREKEINEEFEQSLNKIFRNTSRIVGVIISWEQWEWGIQQIRLSKYRIEKNIFSKYLDKKTEKFLDSFEEHGSDKWIRFDLLTSKIISTFN